MVSMADLKGIIIRKLTFEEMINKKLTFGKIKVTKLKKKPVEEVLHAHLVLTDVLGGIFGFDISLS